MEGTKFLEDRYKLNAEPAVEAAARRTKRATGAHVPQNYDARIGNYFERLEKIFDPPPLEGHPDFNRAQRNINMLKPAILDRYVTKFEDIPESYWKTQERILRERGQQGDYDRFSEEEKNSWKRELSQGLLEDQRASLEQWIDYLTSPDLKDVPSYVKYWAFRSVVGLSEYDKEKKAYPERSKGTVKRYPDVNGEALAYVMDALLKHHKNLPISFDMFDEYIDPAKKDELIASFKENLAKENFAKLYAWANEQIRPIPEGEMIITEGQWIRYKQGSDHIPLVTSIRGKGTGWCTAGESFAIEQLEAGDFYVFYSNNSDGDPINPRIAIRMEQGKIAEVRGIAPRQNLDPYMDEVLAAKLDEFPDKYKYLKKERDMKKLTEIERKTTEGQELSGEELLFLYEVDNVIEGFGYERDPRIVEIIKARDFHSDVESIFSYFNANPELKMPKKVADIKTLNGIEKKMNSGQGLNVEELRFLYELDSKIISFGSESDPRIEAFKLARDLRADISVLYDCEPSQIARFPGEVDENTKVYNGKLEPGVFNQLQKYSIEHVYTSFPDGKIGFYSVTAGGRNYLQLRGDLRKSGVMLDDSTIDLLKNGLNLTSSVPQDERFVVLRVEDMGIPGPAQFDQEVASYWDFQNPTTEQVYNRAKELGLDLCIPEAVPNFVSKYWKNFNWVAFGMEPITNSRGEPKTFVLEGMSFYDLPDFRGSGYQRRSTESFAFMLPKLS